MATIGDLIDRAQEFLHDGGAVWPRSELLTWANDGYRQLLAQSHATVRPFQIDVPGRTAWAGSQEWEDRHGSGTWRLFTINTRSASISATFRWEIQTLEGISPEASMDCITSLWELYYAGDDVDGHCRLVLSKQHERPINVYYDSLRLIGNSVRELDTLATPWWQNQGSPIFWFPAEGGRDGSYEVYEVPAAYVQSYHLDSQEEAGTGMPRLFSGSRTYGVSSDVDRWDYSYSGSPDAGMVPGLGYRFTDRTADETTDAIFPWELAQQDDGTSSDTTSASPVLTHWWEAEISSATQPSATFLEVGLVRGVSSPDRQYMAAPYAHAAYSALGIPRDFKSSDDAITIWEIIVSSTELDEDDALSLIPPRLGKYIKFYILSRAFSRKGRGFQPKMAEHFTTLFQLGVGLFSRIGNLGLIDRNYARAEIVPTQGYRIPSVQLPPEFERQY